MVQFDLAELTNVPGVQVRQAPIPGKGVYFPEAHAVQEELCAAEYCPAGQMSHFEVPALDLVPAGHTPHAVWFANAN